MPPGNGVLYGGTYPTSRCQELFRFMCHGFGVWASDILHHGLQIVVENAVSNERHLKQKCYYTTTAPYVAQEMFCPWKNLRFCFSVLASPITPLPCGGAQAPTASIQPETHKAGTETRFHDVLAANLHSPTPICYRFYFAQAPQANAVACPLRRRAARHLQRLPPDVVAMPPLCRDLIRDLSFAAPKIGKGSVGEARAPLTTLSTSSQLRRIRRRPRRCGCDRIWPTPACEPRACAGNWDDKRPCQQ